MRALIADDDRSTVAVLAATLAKWGFDVVSARDGNAAWEIISSDAPPGLAIIDWMMPGIDGPELCRRIRHRAELSTMHVILLTGRSSRADLIAGLDAGADDYMVKPFEFEELRARVHVGVRVVALQERLAARVKELQRARDTLARVASTDDLTQLCSRGRWFELAAHEIARARRRNGPLGLLMTDLDHFKRINDTHGHGVGDDVLIAFAEMVRTQCRRSDIAGRLGGEEFAVLLPETPVDIAHEVARRLVEGCRGLSVPSSTGPVAFTCSVGVTHVNADERIEAALKRADHGLYQAKRLGRNRSEIELGAPAAHVPALGPVHAEDRR